MKLKVFTVILLIPVFIFISPFPVYSEPRIPENTAHHLLMAIQSRYEKLDRLSCDFDVESKNAGTGLIDKMTGTLWVQFPDKMCWQYVKPEQTVVYDSTDIYIHFIEDNQVFTGSGESVSGVNIALTFFTDAAKLEQEFLVSLLLDSPAKKECAGCDTISLIPRSSGTGVESISLFWDSSDQWIKNLTIKDIYGNNVIYRFKHFKENPKIRKKLFRFTIPADAEVFDLQGNHK